MESRPDRNAMDDAQKSKLIFIALAVVVLILLLISFVSGNKARTQRDEALKQLESLKLDNANLSQYLLQKTDEVDRYKKALEECKAKPKQKASDKKKAAPKSTKKTTTKKKTGQ